MPSFASAGVAIRGAAVEVRAGGRGNEEDGEGELAHVPSVERARKAARKIGARASSARLRRRVIDGEEGGGGFTGRRRSRRRRCWRRRPCRARRPRPPRCPG